VIELLGFAILFGIGSGWSSTGAVSEAKRLVSPRGRDYLRPVRTFSSRRHRRRVQPKTFVWLCVCSGLVGGVITFQILQLVVVAVALALRFDSCRYCRLVAARSAACADPKKPSDVLAAKRNRAGRLCAKALACSAGGRPQSAYFARPSGNFS
jgi:hypothetical protein